MIRELKLELYMNSKPNIIQINHKQEKKMVESSSQTDSVPTSTKFSIFSQALDSIISVFPQV